MHPLFVLNIDNKVIDRPDETASRRSTHYWREETLLPFQYAHEARGWGSALVGEGIEFAMFEVSSVDGSYRELWRRIPCGGGSAEIVSKCLICGGRMFDDNLPARERLRQRLLTGASPDKSAGCSCCGAVTADSEDDDCMNIIRVASRRELPPNPMPDTPTLEARLAECLADIIDTPILEGRDEGSGLSSPLQIKLGFFRPDAANRAAELLEEAGQ